ncbi:O-methyltransferase domain-containing protein [Hirschfeldia incana]|nr:O-methyltransferase domain-containing protein [Hirschfeldia incana]
MMFVNFTGETAESLKSKFREIVASYKGQDLAFLVGDAENSQGALQYFGLEESQIPLIIIQTPDSNKYLKANVVVDQIDSWMKDFKDGKVAAHKKSQPIPAENNEPVKVVVAESLDDIVFNSGKNVLIEFYAPWCGHCQKLAPILDEVALAFQNDPSVIVAKLDATANDIPSDTFDVKGFPTIYFRSADGKVVVYEGSRTKEDFINFIEKNKPASHGDESSTPVRSGEHKTEESAAKDELVVPGPCVKWESEYLGSDDEQFAELFNLAMSESSTLVMKKILQVYKGFEDVNTLVDVGGGVGTVLGLVTSKYPHIKGINFDIASVVAYAPPYPGVQHVAGDMLIEVPKGDAIFMKWVFHAWDDENCIKILKNCWSSLPEKGKVIAVEMVMPKESKSDDCSTNIGYTVDMFMLSLRGSGGERTLSQYQAFVVVSSFAVPFRSLLWSSTNRF